MRTLIVLLLFATALAGEDPAPAELARVGERLRPLHTKLGKPQPGDWLAAHEEPGQTFAQYLRARPVRAVGTRKVLYVQPLGPFTDEQRKIVRLSAEFLGLYFGLETKVNADLGLEVIPANAQRTHPSWGVHQLLSPYILDRVLRPRVPADAAALIAFTAEDLYPDPEWNFVFGQASLRHRVGVWSLHRNGDPARDAKSFRLCLLRTLKTATHETGHMFSIRHCTAWACNMCGSNSLQESDRHPLALCPECLPKLLHATRVDPVQRFEKLIAFCEREGLKPERAFYAKSLEALRSE